MQSFFAVVEFAGCLLPIVCLGFDGDGFPGVVVSSVGAVGLGVGSAGGIVIAGVGVCCSGVGVVMVGAWDWGGGTGGFFFVHPAENSSVSARTTASRCR